ncbi:VIT domain-containing protein [Actinomadura scrupuli]|uniref:VIT domain-containing protein n=1 Tax=Actinomadura scrupuli TaxID=559629 RepID=UPI003D9632E9
MTVHIASLPDEVPPLPDAGLGALTTDRGNLPLDSVDVHAAVTGLAAGIEVTQGFRNPFDVPLEATYVFPLPDRAAVTAMRMEAADRVIEGTLKERGQARQDYDTAIAAGQRAAIAEEDRPDVFTMRVGNILPGERVTVRLTLSQPLPYEDGAATFRFPLVVAPRYIPGRPVDDLPAGDGVEPDTDDVPDASRISPPVLLPGFPDPVRLSLTLELDPAGLPLSEIRSSLHVAATETSGDRTTLRLQPGERLDRDFIVRLGYAPRESSALALVPDASGQEGTFTLTVLPGEATAPRPRDVVLVIDRSGSMMGWKMVAARRSAARIVDTLTDRDRFAVLCFDDRIEEPDGLPAGLSPATDRHRFRAVEHLAKLGARGGTEMLAPLEQAARILSGTSERDRVLVLITDGQIGNEDQILARLAPALERVRVHAVGIDQAVNAGFLNRLAGIGKGRFELVESEDRLDEVMEHIHERIGSPLATGLSLAAEGLSVVPGTVSPRRLGALFPGVPLVIAGRFTGEAAGSLAVRGVAADGSAWEQRAEGAVVDDTASASIWARGHLRDLEDAYVVAGSDELEKRIVSVSLRFNVLCRFTAFVAVDSRVVTSGETPHQVIQPVDEPRGWQPTAAPAAPAAFAPMSAPAPAGPPVWAAGAPTSAFPQTPAPFAAPPARPAPPAPSTRPAPPAGPGSAALPRGRGRSFLRGRMPFPDAPIPPEADEQAQARRQAAEEVTLLAGCVHDSEPVRWHLLSDLRTRLEGLISRLRALGTDVPGLPALVTLVAELAIADDHAQRSDLTGLWDRTVRVLTEFAGATPESPRITPAENITPAEEPAPTRLPFWKKRP